MPMFYPHPFDFFAGNVKRGRPHFIPALGTPVMRRSDPRSK